MNSSGSDDQARGSEEAPPAGQSEECTGNCIHLLFTVCSRNPQSRSIVAGRGGDLDTDEPWARPVRCSSTNKKPAVYLVSRWWMSSFRGALCDSQCGIKLTSSRLYLKTFVMCDDHGAVSGSRCPHLRKVLLVCRVKLFFSYYCETKVPC